MANTNHRSSEPTLSPFLEASTWASELEQWAFIKERVLARLDIRAARKARVLASDLRDAVKEVDKSRALLADDRTALALERIARLRSEAVALIESEKIATPTSRGAPSGSRQRVELLAQVAEKPVRRSGT